jgi:hypothetical protein
MQIIDLPLSETFKALKREPGNPTSLSLSSDDAVRRKHLADHVLGDFSVVFRLGGIVRQDRACDIFHRCASSIAKERRQHHRLIDVRHAHALFDE